MIEYRIPVRALAEFCHRRGDIDYRFTPSPSAAEGIEGHVRLQRRRSYQAEYPLESVFVSRDFSVRLSGRADGYCEDGPLLEEIKTCRVPRDAIPAAVEDVHWAQLLLYGGMLCRSTPGVDAVDLHLTWLNVDTDETFTRAERLARDMLLSFLSSSVEQMVDWLGIQHRWQAARDSSLEKLDFPFPGWRQGQRLMAETVYKCIARGGQVLLEAPTGTGKTAAVLYPALKALGAGKHDRICYSTARTVGRLAAEQALRDFSAAGLSLKRLSVSSREAICFSPGSACHGEDCVYARGYYDRLPSAMHEAMGEPDLDRTAVERIARTHSVCPYQLGMDLLPWVDLCIGDLHHVYSFNAAISQLYADRRLRWSVLLDEAHNLPGRARDMYSAELDKAQLMLARRSTRSRSLRKALDRCNRSFLALNRERWLEPEFDCRTSAPEALVSALATFVAAVGEQQSIMPLFLQHHPALRDFYFAVLQFQRVLDKAGADFCFEMHRGTGKQSLRLRLRCLDPARLLGERQLRSHAVVAFSATASPSRWLLSEMGFSERAVFNSLASPFAPEQLDVVLATDLDTRYRVRDATLPSLVETIHRWLEDRPGNCIVYFSSYQYMAAALGRLRERPSSRHVCVQDRDWHERERVAFLETLRQRNDVVAFCILGGVFGEGIDLPGDALKSVVVVGVGLPQVSRERDVLRDYYQAKLGRGFEYAYQYPGMQRVSQALGRVVRDESDTGAALLIDTRYARPEYRSLLPSCWRYSRRPR